MDFRSQIRVALVLLLPVMGIAIVLLWQLRDPVYRASSGGFWGSQDIPIFWYPLTLAALGWMAGRGYAEWVRSRHPFRREFLAWVLAIIFLHTSPVINGYHFVFLLPLPLCVVAASLIRRFFESHTAPTAKSRWPALVLGIALFASPLFMLIQSLRAAEGIVTTRDTLRLMDTLSQLPRGNVLISPNIGNLVPARTSHRVWAGHWFLTPNYSQRVAEFNAMTSDPQRFCELEALLEKSDIQYLVLPTPKADALRTQFEHRVIKVIPHGDWQLMLLR